MHTYICHVGNLKFDMLYIVYFYNVVHMGYFQGSFIKHITKIVAGIDTVPLVEGDVVGVGECPTDIFRSRHMYISPGSVHGRLRERVSFWREEIKASQYICGIVSSGYRLPFVKFPNPSFQENHRCSKADKEFVALTIAELVVNDCVQKVTGPPLVCSPLQVVAKDEGKRRLVIDLRYVNLFLHKFKFKYEGLDIAAQYWEKGYWFTTFDLKSGYHHIEIHPDYWSYLGFSWIEDGTRVFHLFKVLPFFSYSMLYFHQSSTASGQPLEIYGAEGRPLCR